MPTRAVPGIPDLMHHKFVVRDRASVWTGSTNWTDESWSREENVIVTIDSEKVATSYALAFEELWDKQDVMRSGFVEPRHGARGRRQGAGLVLPRLRRCARAPDREGVRPGEAAHPDLLPGADLRPDPGHAVPDRLRGQGRPRRLRRPDAGRRGLLPVAHERRQRLEDPAARGGAVTRAVLGQALDAVHADERARLHAREGDGRRRRRLLRVVQPLALGRAERREHDRDRGRGARRPARRVHRRVRARYPAARCWLWASGPGTPDPETLPG